MTVQLNPSLRGGEVAGDHVPLPVEDAGGGERLGVAASGPVERAVGEAELGSGVGGVDLELVGAAGRGGGAFLHDVVVPGRDVRRHPQVDADGQRAGAGVERAVVGDPDDSAGLGEAVAGGAVIG